MRKHVDSYMGEKNNKLLYCISKTTKKKIRRLKLKYFAYLFSKECNELKDHEFEKTDIHYRATIKNGAMKLINILLP